MIGGVVLLVLGILGYILPDGRLLGDSLYFDNAENVAHTILGIIAIIAAMALGESSMKWLTVIVGVVALYFGIAGFLVSANAAPNWYGITNLELLDNVLHLVVAAWAFLAAFKKDDDQVTAM